MLEILNYCEDERVRLQIMQLHTNVITQFMKDFLLIVTIKNDCLLKYIFFIQQNIIKCER